MVDILLVVLLCAAAYSRKYPLFLCALGLSCALSGWGWSLSVFIVSTSAALVVIGVALAYLLPPKRAALMALRLCRAEGWRGGRAVAASEPRDGGDGFPTRPGRWLRVKAGGEEYPALMFALDDSPVAAGDELAILHEIWERYDEITSEAPGENDTADAEKAGAEMIARRGLPCEIPPILSPPGEGEPEREGLHRRPALILTYLEVAKKPETYYDLPPCHGLR
jgi:hypothetical protein